MSSYPTCSSSGFIWHLFDGKIAFSLCLQARVVIKSVLLTELQAFLVRQVKHTDEGWLQWDVVWIQTALLVVHFRKQADGAQSFLVTIGSCLWSCLIVRLVVFFIHLDIDRWLLEGLTVKNGLHCLPKMLLESLDVNLFADGKLIKLYFLIGAATSIEPLHWLHLEHVPQVFLLLLCAVISETMGFKIGLLEADFNLTLISQGTEILLVLGLASLVFDHLRVVVGLWHAHIL